MLLADYVRERLTKLPNRLQVAYAAACSEHALPLFEELRSSSSPRDALNLAWEYARGADVTPDDLQRATQEAGAVIPHIDRDDSPEAHLCMSAAVNVLETLDAIQDGSALPAVRAGLGALSAVTIALRMSGADEFADFSDTSELTRSDAFPKLLLEEWNAQSAALTQLEKQNTHDITAHWIKPHLEIGLRIQSWWRRSKK